MYVSEDYEFVYYGPSKTASTAIISFLVDQFGATGVPVPDGGDDRSWPLGPHHSCFLPRRHERFFTFASVRNPYERTVSWFNFLPSRDATAFVGSMTIDDFVLEMCRGAIVGNWRLDCWKRSQRQLIFDQPLRRDSVPVRLDAFVKVESLAADLSRLPFVDRPVSVPVENRSARRRSVFPRRLVPVFYERFREDFDLFGYDPEPPSKWL